MGRCIPGRAGGMLATRTMAADTGGSAAPFQLAVLGLEYGVHRRITAGRVAGQASWLTGLDTTQGE
jgi:hypothetical protein